MSIHRQTSLTPVSLLAGLLLSLPASPVAAAGPAAQGDIVITDFSPDSPDLRWYVQNDNVMGGRSQGGFDIRPGELVFAGSTNTRGGGFSSIRTRPFTLDMSQHDGIQLHVMGDGRRYIWQLQTNARYRGYEISYWAAFDTRDGEWSTVNIPFANFYPQVRGYKLDGPELDPSQITEFGLYIYDNQDGPFELHLDRIAGYQENGAGSI